MEPDASIELLLAHAKEVDSSSCGEEQFAFELMTSTKNYIFGTEFQKVRDQWLNVIKQMNTELMDNHLKAAVRHRKMSVASLSEVKSFELNSLFLSV